jgi:hypothetical protein
MIVMGNDSNKEKLSVSAMIFSIVGVVLIVLGFMLCKNGHFRMQVISVDGIVTGIQTSTDSDGNVVSKSFTISYKANKSDYTATINRVDSPLKMGDKVTLYYDFFEPTSVAEKRGGYYGYLALFLGFIFVLKNGPRFLRIIRDNFL